MPLQAEIKSRSVLGATELTLLAPLRPGLVPAQDTRSYLTRVRAVLGTLHALGISRREIKLTPDLPEVADEIKSIRSFRLSVVNELSAPQVLLSVSFDGGWEPYMRKIWRDLGPLLDLIFCNCQGYLVSRIHGFAEYADWVRRHQVDTRFYYEGSPLTVADMETLREERARGYPVPPPAAGTMFDQARAALVGLYRLTDLHPPGTEDGDVLVAAARALLPKLVHFVGPLNAGTWQTPAEQAAWDWLSQTPPGRPAPACTHAVALDNVQAGILKGYQNRTLGQLALVELDDAEAARKLIDHLRPLLLTAAAKPWQAGIDVVASLAFTWSGLERAGLDEATLRSFPQEFQEGMAQRASILGDMLHNHPRHWALPDAFPPGGIPAKVQMSRVHAIVQLLALSPPCVKRPWSAHTDPRLSGAVEQLHRALGPTGRVVAVQPMQRYVNAKGQAVEHFGFVDGVSQPTCPPYPAKSLPRDRVQSGDVLLGYPNSLEDQPRACRLWQGSTFVVVRKLRQYTERLAAQLPPPSPLPPHASLSDVEALMGRRTDGTNLKLGAHPQNYDYSADPHGRTWPLYAHVRRAHPRATRPDLLALPRIVRRGMSYGPPSTEPSNDGERGLVFVAYNASIAEQFELVQSWLAGANSSGPGSYSGERDPFLGVRRPGDPAAYPLPAAAAGHCAMLPAHQPLVELQWGLYGFVPSMAALEELRTAACERAEDDRITDLDNAPPHTDRARLRRVSFRRQSEAAALAARGAALIARLRQVEQTAGQQVALEQWKAVLEDAGARAAGLQQAVWAAVRQVHGGVLRTPYGVLVASRKLVCEVFGNTQGRYSTSGYNARLRCSFGEIYLGQDAGPGYAQTAAVVNPILYGIGERTAFVAAKGWARSSLSALAPAGNGHTIDLRDYVDGLLERLCKAWFGVPDGIYVQPGGWHQRAAQPAACPVHFNAPSRYTFQPHPGDAVRREGEAHGQVLLQAVENLISAYAPDPPPLGWLGRRLFAALFPNLPPPSAISQFATTYIGVMMGFLPTVDGVLRGVLNEWVQERTLWDHQAALMRRGASPGYAAAAQVLREPLERSMHRRPVPELVWRTVIARHTLGQAAAQVELQPGDQVVVGIASALQEAQAENQPDLDLLFGGGRTAPPGAGPLHACPGQAMAMGVMLGALTALLQRPSLNAVETAQALRLD